MRRHVFGLWVKSLDVPAEVSEILRNVDPVVHVSSTSLTPTMTPQVLEVLNEVRVALQREESFPLSSLLEPYSHQIFRIGPCQPFPSDDCGARRISDHSTTSYIVELFQTAATCAKASLNRFDLHHGHMFFNKSSSSLGIVFHAKEYLKYCPQTFPFDLGYCQRGSYVILNDAADMQVRTVLWIFGVNKIVLLDSSSRMPFGTVYEREFGDVVADIYFFQGRFQDRAENLNRGVHVVPFC